MPKAIDDFLPLVAGQITGCPDALLRDAIREAAIEFCDRTRVLSEPVELTTTEGDPVVDLYLDYGEVSTVEAVRRGDTLLEPLSRRVFLERSLDHITGPARAYYLEADNRLRIGPVPDTAETLIATVAARPSDTTLSLPDELYRDWRLPLAAGARAYIRAIHQAWFEPRLEALDRERFERGVAQAETRRARGGTRRPLRTHGRYF